MGRCKRGEFQFLIYVIIAIAAFLVIVTVWMKAQAKNDDLQAETLCKSSIALRMSAALEVGGSDVKGAPILCKTIDKKIKGDKHDVQLQIAQNMARCWDMMGEGRYNNDVFANFPLFGSENGCFTCYSLIIDDIKDLEEGNAISPSEFEQFLRETPYSKNKEMTYLDYFQRGGGNGRVMGFFGEETNVAAGTNTPAGILEDHAYAVMFKSKKEDGNFLSGAAAVGGTTFLVYGLATGGVGLVVGGAIVALEGGSNLIEKAFRETELDTIILVDLETKTIGPFLKNNCEEISDYEGK
ncbi:hypothetical protein HYV86_05950 [Candidatus Woesearchaeota archaeon]|nr:hypothetical protein [Candidatus Woesearchaeota archaeon]